MKLHGKNLIITLLLCLVLFAVIGTEIILFISGPALRYDDKVSSQTAIILENNEDVKELDRHVFAYVTYIGNSDVEMYWFNEEGDYITKRERATLLEEKAIQKAVEVKGFQKPSVSYGYGYKNPVYVVEDEQGELYLDIDSLEEVFYRVKG